MKRASPSLRRQLIVRMLATMAPLFVLLWGVAYFSTQYFINAAFDRSLARRTYALADQVGQGKELSMRLKTDRPLTGTRLVREWQGVEHIATVLADGYDYQGRPYKSLSAIARAITGTRWNGWVFFALRRAATA